MIPFLGGVKKTCQYLIAMGVEWSGKKSPKKKVDVTM